MFESALARPPTARTRRFESLDEVFDLLHNRSHGGSPLPWLHALQTAARARQAGACDALITAALLHDIGHLASDDAAPDEAPDDHAEFGAGMLAGLFPPIVTEPIRLHGQAGRYLAATQPFGAEVFVSGGCHHPLFQAEPMAQAERLRFMTHRHAGHALRLSHWDQAEGGPIDARRLVDPLRRIAQRCLRDDDDLA